MSVIKLVTVNTAPERAKLIIGRMIEEVKDRYTIVHAANVERLEDVEPTVAREQPDVLFTASMWTPDEAAAIVKAAQSLKPRIMTLSIPYGLQVAKGPEGILEYLRERLPVVLDAEV